MQLLLFLNVLPLTRALNSYQINNSKEQVTSEWTVLVMFHSFEVVLKDWQCGELCGQLDGQRMPFRTWAVLRPSSCPRWFSTSGWRMRGRKKGLFLLISKNSPSETSASSPLNSCFADLEVSLPTAEVSLMAKQPQCHPTKTTAWPLWTSHAPEPLGLGKKTTITITTATTAKQTGGLQH